MITRRKFLQGTTAFFTLAGTGITLGISSNSNGSLASEKSLVNLFFRGGMDSLNFLIPRTGINRSEYETKRPNIRVPMGSILNLNGDFGLPDTCSELYQLYQQGKMTMIHSVGMPDGTGSRSHFESENMFDLGTPGNGAYPNGWLSRHIHSSPNINSSAVIPSMTAGSPSLAHLGDRNVLPIRVGGTVFHPNSGRYEDEHLTALSNMYNGTNSLDNAMQATIDNISILADLDLTIPSSYPSGSFAQSLGLIANLIKSDLGLQVASLSYGGWDTHQNSGNLGTGYYVDRLGTVSAGIGAFFADLTAAGKDDKVVLATQTEFGRRVRENGNRGTDHGTGSAMMVIGGAVSGGQVLGQFPGITDADLYLNTDLRMTTDFRRPLSDILKNFLGNPNIGDVFPGYTGSTSMSLFPTDEIFSDGFD